MATGPRRAYSTATQLTPGTDIARGPQTGVFIACTVAGNVVLKLPGGNLTVPVNVGPTLIDDIEVIGLVVGGTTATATVSVLS